MTPHHNKHHHHKREHAIARVEMYFETDAGQDLEKNMKSQIGDPDFAHIEPFPDENEGFGSQVVIFCLRHGDKTSAPETVIIPLDIEPVDLADVLDKQTAGVEEGTGLEPSVMDTSVTDTSSSERSSEEPKVKEA
ncbi:MAG: hypothetical protein Q9159_000787 [Coniocarpon cinnabarinum]